MEVIQRRLRIYETLNGKRPFEDWTRSLKDPVTVRRIQARLAGVSAGNLGDVKLIGDGVSELRLAFGPGYRIYFGTDGEELIILLSGGDKGSQDRDIIKAKEYWADYRRRVHG